MNDLSNLKALNPHAGWNEYFAYIHATMIQFQNIILQTLAEFSRRINNRSRVVPSLHRMNEFTLTYAEYTTKIN